MSQESIVQESNVFFGQESKVLESNVLAEYFCKELSSRAVLVLQVKKNNDINTSGTPEYRNNQCPDYCKVDYLNYGKNVI